MILVFIKMLKCFAHDKFFGGHLRRNLVLRIKEIAILEMKLPLMVLINAVIHLEGRR